MTLAFFMYVLGWVVGLMGGWLFRGKCNAAKLKESENNGFDECVDFMERKIEELEKRG